MNFVMYNILCKYKVNSYYYTLMLITILYCLLGYWGWGDISVV